MSVMLLRKISHSFSSKSVWSTLVEEGALLYSLTSCRVTSGCLFTQLWYIREKWDIGDITVSDTELCCQV